MMHTLFRTLSIWFVTYHPKINYVVNITTEASFSRKQKEETGHVLFVFSEMEKMTAS
jgi:hypothetical protein